MDLDSEHKTSVRLMMRLSLRPSYKSKTWYKTVIVQQSHGSMIFHWVFLLHDRGNHRYVRLAFQRWHLTSSFPSRDKTKYYMLASFSRRGAALCQAYNIRSPFCQ